MCPGGVVYNLEVENTHTYTANGFVVHNCHRGAARDKVICDYFTEATRCGMTATPFLSGMRDLSEFYEEIAYAKPMLDLIGEGFAPTMSVLSIPVEIDLSQCKTGMTPDGKEYKPKDSAAAIEPYMDTIAEMIKLHAQGRFGIAYLPLIETSKTFADCLRRHGITARHIDGGSKDREQILASFERGDFNWLCNAGVVSIGVDIPRADCLLNLAPIHSPALYQQRAGRPARVLPGVIDDLPEQNQAAERKERIAWSDKPDFLILDLLFQHGKLGVMGPESLVAETEEEAAAIAKYTRKLKNPEDLAAVKAAVRAEKEAALVGALEKAANRARAKDPVAWADAAVLIGDSKLIAYEATQRWELRKPEEFQLRILAKKGINPATVKNKGQAVALLQALDKRYKVGLATLKQLRTLFRINSKRAAGDKIPNPGAVTFAAATEMIGAAFACEKTARLREDFQEAA